MKVQIEGKLYLESDGTQYILREYTGRTQFKDGKEYEHFITKGYFSSIEGALKKLVKMKIMDSTAADLKSLLQEIKEIYDDLKLKLGGF